MTQQIFHVISLEVVLITGVCGNFYFFRSPSVESKLLPVHSILSANVLGFPLVPIVLKSQRYNVPSCFLFFYLLMWQFKTVVRLELLCGGSEELVCVCGVCRVCKCLQC